VSQWERLSEHLDDALVGSPRAEMAERLEDRSGRRSSTREPPRRCVLEPNDGVTHAATARRPAGEVHDPAGHLCRESKRIRGGGLRNLYFRPLRSGECLRNRW